MKKRLILLLLVLFLILIFINSNYIIKNILDYTYLFINNLFFYTFIIYIITSLLIEYDLLSILKPIHYINIMSIISGFPSGPKYIKDLYNKRIIDLDTCNYLIYYNHYPNPLFVIGSISSIISKKYSIFILLSIYMSNFIVSKIFKKKDISIIYHNYISNNSFSYNLTNSIYNSIKTIIIIYGTSIISVIMGLLINKYIYVNSIIYSISFGIFDLTKGIFSTTLIHNKRISSILILLFISFGSISIHLQTKQILSDTNISYKNYLKGRFYSTFISIIIFIMMSSL